MLVTKNKYKKSRHITGRGFVDSMTTALKNIGSYVVSNKDLIAKPLLGAVGSSITSETETNKKPKTQSIKKYYKA